MAREEKKRRRRIPIRWILLAILLIPAAYVGVQVYSATRVTYEYETAITYQMTDSIQAEGIALYPETPVEGSGELGYLVADGERVSAGTQVAEVYTEVNQASVRAQMDELDTQIDLLEKSQNTTATQIDGLLSQRSTALYQLLESLDRGNLAQLTAVQEEYLLAQNKLQVTTGEVHDFSALISELTVQRDTLAQQLSGLTAVTAPINGYFVRSSNTQLLACAVADVQAMTPVQLQQLLADGAEKGMDGLAGKLISGYTWQFCGLCSYEDSLKFEGVSTVQISFPGKAEEKLPATVVGVERDQENGVAKFTLQCEYLNADVLKLGQDVAQIDFKTYTGLRVSADAIHLVREDQLTFAGASNTTSAASSASSAVSASSTTSASSATSTASAAGSAASQDAAQSGDATASQAQSDSETAGGADYVAGVYVKYGNLAVFRRIQELYRDESGEYILVPADGAIGGESEVRLYDEIIVAGANLYNGKLL